MGKLKNGAFGHLNGRIGNLVFYTLNGENIARISGKSTKPPTEKQLANYQRMTVVNRFQKPLVPFLNVSFAKAGIKSGQKPYNEALSHNKINALQGEYPSINIDYSKALVASGDLPPALNPAITVVSDGVAFSWQMPYDLEWHYGDNRAMLLLYFPEGTDASGIPAAVYEFSGARRKECADFVSLTPAELVKPFEAYIAFIADDRLQVSNSIWAGSPNSGS